MASISILVYILLLAAVPLLSYLLIKRTDGGRRRRWHPIVSTAVQIIPNLRRLPDYMTDLSRRHKSFRVLISPFRSEIFTNDPAVVEHILRTNFDNYVKGSLYYDLLGDFFGDGIFIVDGPRWRQQRKIASQEFSPAALKDTSALIFKKKGVLLADVISRAADAGRVVDLQEVLIRAATDAIFEASLGAELGSLEGASAEARELFKALVDSTELLSLRFYDPLWKLKRFFNVGSGAAMKKTVKVIDDCVFKHIQASTTAYSATEKRSILSAFLRERDRDPESVSHRDLRDAVVSFLIAGKDTTGATLAWFFYLLCKHPRVEEKIFREVNATVITPDATSAEEFIANVTEESLSKMAYLHAALNETLRLHPPVAMDAKFCFKDDTLPDGCGVRAGECIYYLPYSMGRMENLWGEDAAIFRPERWIDEDDKFCPASPFKFPVFQAGPRICIGKDFAYRQMKIFAAILIRLFTFKLRDEEEELRYKMSFTLLVDQGLLVSVFRR